LFNPRAKKMRNVSMTLRIEGKRENAKHLPSKESGRWSHKERFFNQE
jgi:hypothetical protein